jgi:hypothetical protein
MSLTNAEDSDLENLAEVISALSHGESPNCFENPPAAFEPDEIDWTTNDWLAKVIEVHEWFALDESLNHESSPDEVVRTLFVLLGLESVENAFSIKENVIRLSSEGARALQSRADRANNLKQLFEKDLADDLGLMQATRLWESRCEERPNLAKLQGVEVHAEVDTWKIKDFKDQAEAGQLELNPSYQRDVVWQTGRAQTLLDSVLRGIPLPSIILHKRHHSNTYEIVDGKQRLTAILRFMGYHPEAVEYANSRSTPDAPFELFRSDYRKWRKKLKISSAEEREHLLPFPLSVTDNLKPLNGKYYCEIRKQLVKVQGVLQPVANLFENPSKTYLLPVIIYSDTDIEQIHKVFGLYNDQGVPLNAEELRNAIYHHLDLTKLLLVVAGDRGAPLSGAARPSTLVPFTEGLNTQHVTEMFAAMNISSERFHRSKLTAWVVALILHAPKVKNDGTFTTPSTAAFIDAMLDGVGDSKSAHPMTHRKGLTDLGRVLVDGASLMRDLLKRQAFEPKFIGRRGDGVRWDDLPAVASWLACSLAVVGGQPTEADQSTFDAVKAYSAKREPPEKQQSPSQWAYIVRTVLGLISAMQVDVEALSATLRRQFGYSCIPTFSAVDALKNSGK